MEVGVLLGQWVTFPGHTLNFGSAHVRNKYLSELKRTYLMFLNCQKTKPACWFFTWNSQKGRMAHHFWNPALTEGPWICTAAFRKTSFQHLELILRLIVNHWFIFFLNECYTHKKMKYFKGILLMYVALAFIISLISRIDWAHYSFITSSTGRGYWALYSCRSSVQRTA